MHLIGATKKLLEDDPTFQNWDLEDSIVISWLIDSMELKIGLNEDLDEVQKRILGNEPMPPLDEVFAEVRREKNRRKMMLGEEKDLNNSLVEDSSLASKDGENGYSGE
ncbi:hypothetical protein CK203_060399 [Vitis vinifera]|uniref:Uncharacterized protein n=1 Tax=Vitis vinifera TaxID=29760 RepID=A0A438GBK6_VITVI|nr:hypothetical protein CK203_060399 [Vitis vinifera]